MLLVLHPNNNQRDDQFTVVYIDTYAPTFSTSVSKNDAGIHACQLLDDDTVKELCRTHKYDMVRVEVDLFAGITEISGMKLLPLAAARMIPYLMASVYTRPAHGDLKDAIEKTSEYIIQ